MNKIFNSNMLKSHFFGTFNSKLILISTFCCFFLSYIINENVQNILIFIGILSFGIVHGANDIILLSKNLDKANLNTIKLILMYSLMVVFSAVFFYFFPLVALIFFVLYSSYHFGEQQWTLFEKKSEKLHSLYFGYGSFIFSLLFLLNQNYVSFIITDITGIELLSNHFYLYFSSSLLIFSIGLFLSYKLIIEQLLIQLVLLCVLCFLFYFSDLMLSFAVFFVFWHSIPSIIEQTKYIYGKNNFESIFKYFKKAFLYWIMSIIGLGLFFYILKDDQSLLISVFFSFLAAITLPHTLVIFKIKIK